MARSKSAKGMAVEVTGDDDLRRKFRALEGVGKADVLEKIILAVAEPIRDASAQRAPRLTGNLADNIITVTLTKRQDECVVGIGPSDDAWYGIFPEIGTSTSPAQPYLRPSFDEGKEPAKQQIADQLRGEVERVAKQ